MKNSLCVMCFCLTFSLFGQRELEGWFVKREDGLIVRSTESGLVHGGRPYRLICTDTMVGSAYFKKVSIDFDIESANDYAGYMLVSLKRESFTFIVLSEQTALSGRPEVFLVPEGTEYIALKYNDYKVFRLD